MGKGNNSMADIQKQDMIQIDPSLLSEDEQEEIRLNRFVPVGVYDDAMQEINLTFSVKELLASAVRKVDAETGRKKPRAVMLALPTDVTRFTFRANGNLYETTLSLGRQNAGAYMTIGTPKLLGKLAPAVA